MDAEVLFDALSHMPSEIRRTNFWKTVGDLEVRALVIRMHYSLAQAQLKIPGHTLREVQNDALADTLPDTLAELKSEKVGNSNRCEDCIRSLNAGGHASRCGDQNGWQNIR